MKIKDIHCKRNKLKICAIDIGTNSVLYLLAQIDIAGHLKVLNFKVKTTRLGKSLKNKGILSSEAQHRTINTAKKFLKDARQKGAFHYTLSGTSALREARNSAKFIQQLKKETDKRLIILTETQEAKLTFSAVKHFMGLPSGSTIVADIGGGSTELILAHKGKPLKTTSIPIGAVNLTEKFRNNIEETEKFIKGKLIRYTHLRKSINLIGVGGTVTTLGAILLKLKRYDPAKVHKYIVTKSQLTCTIDKLNSLTLKDRKKLIPFDPKRADIIIAGLLILKTIMEIFDIEKIKICDRGLVYGLALSYSKYTRGTFNLHRTS